MNSKPLMFLCEGSDTPRLHHLCPMCGIPLSVLSDGELIPAHDRRDIIAELDRGDYDEDYDA